MDDPHPQTGPDGARLLWFCAAAVIVGGVTGLVASSFRLVLDHLGTWRTDFVGWSHGHSAWGCAAFVLSCAAATAAAALLVHRAEPHAEGSGIPRVEAVVEGRAAPGRLRILPVKYVGGLLAMGPGLALGREGPSVQMGGIVAVAVSRVMRLSSEDLRILVAGGAAAGLATAFDAPIAGGVFVLEELLKRFDLRTTLATLLASGSGFLAARLVIPNGTVFSVASLEQPRAVHTPTVVVVALTCGVLGVAFNAAVMAGLHWADHSRIPVSVRAVAIGAAVGVIAWIAPSMVGGGDNLTQEALLGHGAVITACGVLALRFALTVASYAATTPGGIFAPMLTLGAETGLIVGLAATHLAPDHAPQAAGMALVGMVAFFTASVRAPVTGLVLGTEMTGSTVLLPPMLGACAIAMLVAMLLRSTPIYDALTARAANRAPSSAGTTVD
ncbi:ClC family H(+)/Cl(-) exchange transporter [Tsukamurella soli]|uniref:H(+)/Cl(-) exchange transporter ClcA n=1 Tax=Tsukamurella soli TaxID=644556 RepID=A0ABP8K5N9_9ACTN